MTGTFGAGSWLMGVFLWWDSDGALAAIATRLGELAPITTAIPGLLMLLGTATLGFALIRLQNA